MHRSILTLALLALPLSLACGDKEGDDTGTSDGGATDGGTDGGVECDTTNEDCGPGSCDGEGANMLPGSDCVACHSPGNFEEDEGDAFWTAAGTVFVDDVGSDGKSGAIVRITDSTGSTVELATSSAGNFYTTDPLVPPLSAEVEVEGVVIEMGTEVETGACNSCHKCEGDAGAKLYAP